MVSLSVGEFEAVPGQDRKLAGGIKHNSGADITR